MEYLDAFYGGAERNPYTHNVAINRETYKVVSELYDIVHGVRDEGSRPKTTPRPLTQDEQKRLMDKAIKQGFEDDALDLIAASAAIRDATKEM